MSTYLALCTVAAACLGVGAVQAFHVNRAQAAAGAVQDDADAGLSQAFAHSVALSQTEAGTVPCTPCGVQTASVNCCMERAVESREKNYIEELKNYTDEEREARIEATARLFNTSEEMLRFKDVQFAYDKSNAVRNATYRSKMKAEADAQAQLASIAAQAAQQARLQTAEFYADKEARRAAKDIAGVVRVEEVQKAQKGIEDTSVDIVQGVRKDTIDLVSKIKQADEAAKLAAATKCKVPSPAFGNTHWRSSLSCELRRQVAFEPLMSICQRAAFDPFMSIASASGAPAFNVIAPTSGVRAFIVICPDAAIGC